MRIVLIDDEPAQGSLWGAILRSVGYSVTFCQDAESGLAAVNQGCDCVITDYQMPGMDGIELIRQANRRPALCIMLTGVESPEIHRRALAAGADYVVTKPTQPGVLLAVLARLYRQAHFAVAVGRPSRERRPMPPTSAVALSPDLP